MEIFVPHSMPRPKTQNVKVQNLERDLVRRALVSEAPEASQGPKGPIWRVETKYIFNPEKTKTPTKMVPLYNRFFMQRHNLNF